MARLSKRETQERQTLYQLGYEYLRKNFRKFNQQNKIKIAISMLQIFEKDDSKSALAQPNNVVQIAFIDKKPETQGTPECRFVSSQPVLDQ